MKLSATFNYLSDATEPSLYRNGRVRLDRDADGNDSGLTGVERVPCAMPVHDARVPGPGAAATLARQGFELLDAPVAAGDVDFLDHRQVVTRYYPDCERIVGQATGARALAFDHNLRSAQRKGARIQGGQQVQEPIRLVHGDYTLTSAPQRLRDLSRPPTGNDSLRGVLPEDSALLSPELAEHLLSGGRFAIINLWRNLDAQPVQRSPLALCDAQSVQPSDLVVFELHYPGRIGENYFSRHSTRHRWHYYPRMRHHEALLIKQWDSAGALARSGGAVADHAAPDAPCTFSFHSAFDLPDTAADAPDRQSIEVRCLVLYDTA